MAKWKAVTVSQKSSSKKVKPGLSIARQTGTFAFNADAVALVPRVSTCNFIEIVKAVDDDSSDVIGFKFCNKETTNTVSLRAKSNDDGDIVNIKFFSRALLDALFPNDEKKGTLRYTVVPDEEDSKILTIHLNAPDKVSVKNTD